MVYRRSLQKRRIATEGVRRGGMFKRQRKSSPRTSPKRQIKSSPRTSPQKASPKASVVHTFITSDIPVPKYTYPFDKNKADIFIKLAEIALEGYNPEPYNNVEYYKLLMKKTQHVSWDTFIHNLVLAVNGFSRTVTTTDFVLYVPFDHDKSNYWISQIVYHLLPKKPAIIAMSLAEIPMGMPVLLCDDGVYSSKQISRVLYDVAIKDPIDTRVNLIVPYISDYAVENLAELFKVISERSSHNKTLSIYYTVLMKPLIDPTDMAPDSVCLAAGSERRAAVTGSRIKPKPRFMFSGMYCSKRLNAFAYMRQMPIYFDHKLPDKISSFPGIYARNTIIQRWLDYGMLSYMAVKNKGGMIIGCKSKKTSSNDCPPPPYKHKTADSTLMLTPSEFVKKYGGY